MSAREDREFPWVVCKTIGCSGPLARWFEWPHRLCSRIQQWVEYQ